MVLRYNTKQQSIEARARIATAEGYPKYANSATLYYLNYQELNGGYYINAIGEESKGWYSAELGQANEVLNEFPQIDLS